MTMKKMIYGLIEIFQDWKQDRAFKKRLKKQQKRDPFIYK
jgi:hypothetical protein